MKEFKKEDLGSIDFGKMTGKKWNEVEGWYLEFIISDECRTSEENKETARREIKNRRICEGQLEMF